MRYEKPVMEIVQLFLNESIITASAGEYVEGETDLGTGGVITAPDDF